MPNYDGGHYCLTALLPIRVGEIKDGTTFTSPSHALRKVLAKLPGSPTLAFASTDKSPFTQNEHLHFARLAIIDDVAYNGRLSGDTLVGQVTGNNPVIAQEQDHLNRSYLLLSLDFDAADGAPETRDAFLATLWSGDLQAVLAEILTHCEGFDPTQASADRFARYVADCQIETTLPFNDYYIDPNLYLQTWPWREFSGFAALGLAVVLGLALLSGAQGFGVMLVVLAALAVIGYLAVGSVERFSDKPFPVGPKLPEILKALHLQHAFTQFVIDNQLNSVRPGGDAELQANFKAFLVKQQPPAPQPQPTQAPGVLGI